jgi:phytoene dehydrogenase-like protein
MPRPGLLAIVVPCLVLLAGCATHITRLEPVRAAFHRGDLDEAERLIAADLEKHPGDADVLTLDRALVALADGRPLAAEDLLKEVRDRFDHFEQESPAEDAWSMLSDDQQRSYAGDDHEKVLLRAMLAITNLSSDGARPPALHHALNEPLPHRAGRLGSEFREQIRKRRAV